MNLDQPCYVYRCFVDEECVYVGSSIDPSVRMENHRNVTPWAWAVTLVESSLYLTIPEARTAETAEIRRLRPRWNLTERGARSTWQLSDYVEVLLATCAKRLAPSQDQHRVNAQIARLKRELSWRFPDVAALVLADIEPYTPTFGTVA